MLPGVMTTRRAEARDAPRIGEVWYAAWADAHRGNVPDALLPHRRPEHFARRAEERIPHTGDFPYEASTEDGPITGPCRRYERRLAM